VILHLTCSPKGPAAYSRRFSATVVERLRAAHPSATVTERDLAATPPPPPTPAFSAAVLSAAPPDDPAFAHSELLLRELEACDALVIGTPMHNYTVPAVLKAWIDQIVRIHRSFASTPAGKVGKLRDRPVYVVVASGGWYSDSAPAGVPRQPDFLTPYLRAILATIGLHTVHFITLEGVTRGPAAEALAFATAQAALDRLLPPDLAHGVGESLPPGT
jgi:FMN-dependent NADH-azoreductase